MNTNQNNITLKFSISFISNNKKEIIDLGEYFHDYNTTNNPSISYNLAYDFDKRFSDNGKQIHPYTKSEVEGIENYIDMLLIFQNITKADEKKHYLNILFDKLYDMENNYLELLKQHKDTFKQSDMGFICIDSIDNKKVVDKDSFNFICEMRRDVSDTELKRVKRMWSDDNNDNINKIQDIIDNCQHYAFVMLKYSEKYKELYNDVKPKSFLSKIF